MTQAEAFGFHLAALDVRQHSEVLERVVGEILAQAGVLAPGKTYAIWLNSENFGNFKDTAGHAAVPYLLIFKTKP